MSLIVAINGSPSASSRTTKLTSSVGASLAADGFDVRAIHVRDIPAEDLLHARADAPAVRAALGLVERASGVIISTPIYKASYTGILKAFLDLLPQFGLAGKVVLPLCTGGTTAHVLAIDYALRPVLMSLGAPQVVEGLFVLDKTIEIDAAGTPHLPPELRARLDGVVGQLALGVHNLGARRPPRIDAAASAA
jgi:FMN reductase